jgi:hypothetical protein
MMLANIHPFFEWSQQGIIWTDSDGGYMTTEVGGETTGIVSARSLPTDSPIEGVFRFRRVSGVRSVFGFSMYSPDENDFNVNTIPWGLDCNESGYIKPTHLSAIDCWDMLRLSAGIYDCRISLDASDSTIAFAIEMVDSSCAPLSDFTSPLFETVEWHMYPDSLYLQLNMTGPLGRYYDVWLTQGGETSTLLTSFDASVVEGKVELKWTLSESMPADCFEVQRRLVTDEMYVPLRDVFVTRDGTSFLLVDNSVNTGLSYMYRVFILEDNSRTMLFETDYLLVPRWSLTLYQNYPNPFNPSTTIVYFLPVRSLVTLDIYDVTGSFITRLVDSRQDTGMRSISWNGTNHLGSAASSGVYFCRLRAGKETRSIKFVLLR